ncbi:MAG TPA: amidohydrolase [Bryobacteraceae bacterium]|nr:amidohydrolase [Bryobacteraceae bacterium]
MIRTACLFLAVSLLPAAPPLVIRNANLITITKGNFRGAVLIDGGKIAAFGDKVVVPPNARVIDAGGQYVTPGIIDPHSHVGTDSVNESALAVASMTGIGDVLNPENIGIYRALAGGVTTIAVLHGSADPIGGKCEIIKTRWGKDAEGIRFEGAPPYIKFALGENVKRSGGVWAALIAPGNLRYPATRMGVEDVFRQAFTDARAYQKAWREYDENRKRGVEALPPRRDLTLEPLVEVLERKRLVHTHAYRADEILMIMRVAEEFGFKINVLVHVLEGYKVAREIAAHGASASTFSDWWAYKMEAYDAIPYNAAIMAKKGVLVSLNSDNAELMRRMNTEAAKVMKYGGVSENDALAMITLNPAKQLGIEDRVGSIETGKDADLVIWDRHPLSNYAKVQKVLVDGELYFDRDTDIGSRPARNKQRQELLEKAKARQNKAAPENKASAAGRPQ